MGVGREPYECGQREGVSVGRAREVWGQWPGSMRRVMSEGSDGGSVGPIVEVCVQSRDGKSSWRSVGGPW